MGRGRRWRALAGLAEPQINACDLDLVRALGNGFGVREWVSPRSTNRVRTDDLRSPDERMSDQSSAARMQAAWREAAAQLGIEVVAPFEVDQSQAGTQVRLRPISGGKIITAIRE
jgi:hypothetical protein